MNENKERNIGLDFLRIISMIMVLILHYLSKGGLLKESNSYSVNYIIYNILKIASIIAVNCYVLISSYFLVKSKFRIKKFLKLWLEVIFYSVSIYLLLVMFGLIQFNFGDAIQSILPIISKQYWFITVYLVMYLLSPFLNKLIYALDKEEYRKLLIIIMIIFSGMTLLPSKWTLDETYGYGIIWFICNRSIY